MRTAAQSVTRALCACPQHVVPEPEPAVAAGGNGGAAGPITLHWTGTGGNGGFGLGAASGRAASLVKLYHCHLTSVRRCRPGLRRCRGGGDISRRLARRRPLRHRGRNLRSRRCPRPMQSEWDQPLPPFPPAPPLARFWHNVLRASTHEPWLQIAPPFASPPEPPSLLGHPPSETPSPPLPPLALLPQKVVRQPSTWLRNR